jgi:hypothetical protein
MLRRLLSAKSYGIHMNEDGNHWFFRDDEPDEIP